MSNPRGRPKLETTKKGMLGVRLTQAERMEIDSAATRVGQKKASAWAREILLAEARKVQ